MRFQTTSTRSVSKSPGFTLIELIVVLAILMLLISAALIGIRNGQIASRDSQRTANVLSVSRAIDQYSAANRGALFTAGANDCLKTVVGNNLDKYFPNNQLPADVLPMPDGGESCIRYSQNTPSDKGSTLSDLLKTTYTLEFWLERPISEEAGLYVTDSAGVELGPVKKVPKSSTLPRYYYPGPYCGDTCP